MNPLGSAMGVFLAHAWTGRASSGGTLAATIRPEGHPRPGQTSANMDATAAAPDATTRTWFQRVHSRTYAGRYAAASGAPGSIRISVSLRGTLATIVTREQRVRPVDHH